MLRDLNHHIKLLNHEDTPFIQDFQNCNGNKYFPVESQNNGVTITWSDLSVYVPCEEQKFFTRTRTYYKRVVNNVSGAVPPGSLVAILGPSGAGKSTMLSAIAHRYHGNILVDGDVLINGRKSDESMCYSTGYMYQEDFFIGALTVKEHLSFMARLKMDRRISKSSRETIVYSLIEQLGLSSVANCKIGGLAVDGEKLLLSGGEKKRLSFATACLNSPKLLFADEPTTGLDSFTAGRLVGLMRGKAYATGASLICTIHQPSAEVLAMFNTIYLLADGMLIFTGSTEEAMNFFESSGYILGKQMTHGEFIVKCVAPTPGAENATKVAVRKFANDFTVSENYKHIETAISFQKQIGKVFHQQSSDYKPAFWFHKLYWLCHRGYLENLRNPNLQWMKIFQKMLIAITAGLCYFGTIHLDQAGIQAVQGVLFVLVSENTFAPMYAALTNLPGEFPMFIREHSNGAYSSLIYYLSRIISSFPGLVIEAILFTSFVYFLAGLRSTFYAFTMINLLTILCINVSASCGTFFSAAFDSVPLAMTYLIPFDYVAMITSGLFVKLSTLPVVTMWMQYLSWLMYTYESLSIVQWQQTANITCTEGQPSLPCLKSGDDVLENYSFSEDNLQRNILSLVTLYLCFHLLGYLFFVRKINKKF